MPVCAVGVTIVAAPTRAADSTCCSLHPRAYSSRSDWGELQSNGGWPAICTGKGRGQVGRLLKRGIFLRTCALP